jgi:hypothetical protein
MDGAYYPLHTNHLWEFRIAFEGIKTSVQTEGKFATLGYGKCLIMHSIIFNVNIHKMGYNTKKEP